MAERFSVAIAGAGLMGHWHARYARQCGASVSGIMDCDLVAAQRLARRIPSARPYADMGEMIASCRPQVVHICTPIDSHVQLAQDAMRAGAHVLMEKPIAPNAAISRDLLATAAQSGLLLAPVHQFLFQDGFRQACKWSSGLGRILHIDADFCSAGGEGANPNRLDEIAAEILPHPLAMIERLVPGTLSKVAWHAVRTSAGEWRASGAVNGLSMAILISLHGRPTESSMRIVAERGVIDLDLFHGFATIDTVGSTRAAKIGRPFRGSAKRLGKASWNLLWRLATREFAYPGLRRLISEFYEAVHIGTNGPIGVDEIIAVCDACDFLKESILRGERRTNSAE